MSTKDRHRKRAAEIFCGHCNQTVKLSMASDHVALYWLPSQRRWRDRTEPSPEDDTAERVQQASQQEAHRKRARSEANAESNLAAQPEAGPARASLPNSVAKPQLAPAPADVAPKKEADCEADERWASATPVSELRARPDTPGSFGNPSPVHDGDGKMDLPGAAGDRAVLPAEPAPNPEIQVWLFLTQC
jgi:hypothetical protein